jgi:hypothetical protein
MLEAPGKKGNAVKFKTRVNLGQVGRDWCTQSVMIRKKTAVGKDARMARSHVLREGYRAPKVDETPGFWRFRQLPPGHFQEGSMGTLCVSKNMCFVRGVLKRGKACPVPKRK